jgi:hypothetical protein
MNTTPTACTDHGTEVNVDRGVRMADTQPAALEELATRTLVQ